MLSDGQCEVIRLDKGNDGWLKNTIRQLEDMILDVQVQLAPLSDSGKEIEDDESEVGGGSGEDDDGEEEAQEHEAEVREDEQEDDKEDEVEEENNAE